MNLYLISQAENTNYDTYDAAVVAAESEEDARQIRPDGGSWSSAGRWSCWCSSPAVVSVQLLGIAVTDTKPGVILASFKCGLKAGR